MTTPKKNNAVPMSADHIAFFAKRGLGKYDGPVFKLNAKGRAFMKKAVSAALDQFEGKKKGAS